MSEPKIGEFLVNFKIEVSTGSLSNILTKTADRFEDVYWRDTSSWTGFYQLSTER